MEFFNILADLGFPIAGSIAAGYFIFLILKFILAGVVNSIRSITDIIERLESRVETINTEVQRLDIRISHALGLEPDYERISRAEKSDQRVD